VTPNEEVFFVTSFVGLEGFEFVGDLVGLLQVSGDLTVLEKKVPAQSPIVLHNCRKYLRKSGITGKACDIIMKSEKLVVFFNKGARTYNVFFS
jgi:hypothetical protein